MITTVTACTSYSYIAETLARSSAPQPACKPDRWCIYAAPTPCLCFLSGLIHTGSSGPTCWRDAPAARHTADAESLGPGPTCRIPWHTGRVGDAVMCGKKSADVHRRDAKLRLHLCDDLVNLSALEVAIKTALQGTSASAASLATWQETSADAEKVQRWSLCCACARSASRHEASVVCLIA